MSMGYIRKTYGVPAKRGMAVRVRDGHHKGRVGVIRRARHGYLVVTDKPGRYGWWAVFHPKDLEYIAAQPGGSGND